MFEIRKRFMRLHTRLFEVALNKFTRRQDWVVLAIIISKINVKEPFPLLTHQLAKESATTRNTVERVIRFLIESRVLIDKGRFHYTVNRDYIR